MSLEAALFEGTESRTTSSVSGNNGSRRTVGLVLLGLTGATAVGLSVVCAPFVLPALRKICLPFVPATTDQMRNVMTALLDAGRASRPGSMRLLDLGSGDGRLVISTAQKGFLSEGVELNYWLVLYSRLKARSVGLARSQAAFYRQDLWKVDLGAYDNVIIFGIQEMMEQLEEKMRREMRPNGCVVACRFPLPSLTPSRIVGSGIDTVWLYHTDSIRHQQR